MNATGVRVCRMKSKVLVLKLGVGGRGGTCQKLYGGRDTIRVSEPARRFFMIEMRKRRYS